MGIKSVVINRILFLCKEKNWKLNTLANEAGVTASTIYSMVNPDRQDIGIVLIKKICDGLNISITEFFNTDEFNLLDQEIK